MPSRTGSTSVYTYVEIKLGEVTLAKCIQVYVGSVIDLSNNKMAGNDCVILENTTTLSDASDQHQGTMPVVRTKVNLH